MLYVLFSSDINTLAATCTVLHAET